MTVLRSMRCRYASLPWRPAPPPEGAPPWSGPRPAAARRSRRSCSGNDRRSVQAREATDAELLQQALAPMAEAVSAGPQSTGWLANLSFLVGLGSAERFLAAVDEFRQEHPHLELRVNGPLRPTASSTPLVPADARRYRGGVRTRRSPAKRVRSCEVSGTADPPDAGNVCWARSSSAEAMLRTCGNIRVPCRAHAYTAVRVQDGWARFRPPKSTQARLSRPASSIPHTSAEMTGEHPLCFYGAAPTWGSGRWRVEQMAALNLRLWVQVRPSLARRRQDVHDRRTRDDQRIGDQSAMARHGTASLHMIAGCSCSASSRSSRNPLLKASLAM